MKSYQLLILTLFLLFSNLAFAKQLTIENTSPVVIQTLPVAGMKSVDPETTEIRVTFSKEMATQNSWSVIQYNQASFPQINGDVHYLSNKKTFVIPVKLKANTVYALGLNSKHQTGFRDSSGIIAQPYQLVFKTRAEK